MIIVEKLLTNPYKKQGIYSVINNSLRWNAKNSEYPEKIEYWSNFLRNIGRFKL